MVKKVSIPFKKVYYFTFCRPCNAMLLKCYISVPFSGPLSIYFAKN